ncbi:hypothetical protein BJ956_000547 [Arthrobacter psychrochitiniphilus]|nr:hypothetical protein [Arthrobacter psychrochitiniphilus]
MRSGAPGAFGLSERATVRPCKGKFCALTLPSTNQHPCATPLNAQFRQHCKTLHP